MQDCLPPSVAVFAAAAAVELSSGPARSTGLETVPPVPVDCSAADYLLLCEMLIDQGNEWLERPGQIACSYGVAALFADAMVAERQHTASCDGGFASEEVVALDPEEIACCTFHSLTGSFAETVQ